MKHEHPSSMSLFFTRLRAGDRESAAGLWHHFFPRLIGLARRVLDSRPLPVLDAEDVAQSAFASFWQRAERGDFAEHLDRNELWRILATITVRKARRNMARELTEKRGGGRIVRETSDAYPHEGGLKLDQTILATMATGDFDLACEELLERLDTEELQTIALYRLMGHTNREIAELLDCTERKIERKLQLIRATWSRFVEPG